MAHDSLERWGCGDVGSVKAAKRAGEDRKQLASALSGKTVTFDLQEAEIGENGDGDWAPGGMSEARGVENLQPARGGVTLTKEENQKLSRQSQNK